MSLSPGLGLKLALAALILLVALQLGITLSAALSSGRDLGGLTNRSIASQTAAAARLLDRISTARRQDAIDALNTPYMHFTLVERFPKEELQGPVLPTFEPAIAVYREVLGDERDFRVYRRNHDGLFSSFLFGSQRRSGNLSDDLIILVALWDGSALAVEASSGYQRQLLMNVLAVAIAAIGLICLFLLVWAAIATSRPIARIGAAADRLAGDLNAPPLEESGPVAVRNLARSFNSMQRQIARLVAQRTTTLAAVAHDFRTFLTRLRLRMEFIEDETQRDKAVRDLDEMTDLIGETLFLAEQTTGPKDLDPIEITHLVEEIAGSRRDTGSHVELDIDDDAPGLESRISPIGLRRALGNLLDNAIRYGSVAKISLRRDGESILIRVSDDGPGVPEAELSRLTDPFYRVEQSRSRHTGGAGLGLAIAHSLIEASHGSLTLSNSAGGGLVADICLPIARP